MMLYWRKDRGKTRTNKKT